MLKSFRGGLTMHITQSRRAKAARTGSPAYVQAVTETTVAVWAEGY